MSYEQICYDVDDSIATVTLNRPEKLNAWTRQMEHEVRAAMTAASSDEAVRAIILTGAGRGFCAGADMDMLDNVSASGADPRPLEDACPGGIAGGLDLPPDFHMRYAYFPTVPKPIIAAINGPAAGLGLIMALYCDVRFVAQSAVLTTAFSRRGLIAEHGISWLLPALVGHAHALDLLLSARKVTADEALRMGLVNQLCADAELMGSVRAYARELALAVSPRSVRVMKRQVYRATLQSLEDATMLANAEMPGSFASEDFREGVQHFIERRPARFSGR